MENEVNAKPETVAAEKSAIEHSKRVFVVHGHDNEAKETVARFIERLGLEPIILHEHPQLGTHDHREV